MIPEFVIPHSGFVILFTMPHRIYHVLEAVLGSVIMLATTASSELMLAEAQSSDVDELRMLLLPLIGSLIMSGGMIMLNPSPETRRRTIGRAIIALFLGASMPQVIAMFHPRLAGMVEHPVLLLVSGGLISALIFILARPFVEGFYRRSERIAESQLDEVERRITPKHDDP